MKVPIAAVVLSSLLFSSPGRAGSDEFFEFSSDFLRAMHLARWAAGVDVSGNRPLVPLVLALEEQRQKLNESRQALLKYENSPAAEVRRPVDGLKTGTGMLALVADADISEINAMKNRSKLAGRIDGRAADRRQAVEVMAAGVQFFRESLIDRPAKGGAGARARLTADEAVSLLKQIDLLFGDELTPSEIRASLFLSEIEKLRQTLAAIKAPASGPAKKSP